MTLLIAPEINILDGLNIRGTFGYESNIYKEKIFIKQLLTEVLSLQDRVDLQKFPVINKLTVGINTAT